MNGFIDGIAWDCGNWSCLSLLLSQRYRKNNVKSGVILCSQEYYFPIQEQNTKLTLTTMCTFFFLFWGLIVSPDKKVHGANMGPTWVLSAPDGPHVGPMNLVIKVNSSCLTSHFRWPFPFFPLSSCQARKAVAPQAGQSRPNCRFTCGSASINTRKRSSWASPEATKIRQHCDARAALSARRRLVCNTQVLGNLSQKTITQRVELIGRWSLIKGKVNMIIKDCASRISEFIPLGEIFPVFKKFLGSLISSIYSKLLKY